MERRTYVAGPVIVTGKGGQSRNVVWIREEVKDRRKKERWKRQEEKKTANASSVFPSFSSGWERNQGERA
jgi:hypothetical protein